MKRIIPCILIIFMIFTFNITASGADSSIDCTLDIPANNTINKSINSTVGLNADDICSLGAIMITVTFDPSVIEYKEASLCDNISGSIDAYADNGSLKIIYLNTSGTDITENRRDFVNVRFTAKDKLCDTNINIMSEQAVSQDERYLSVKDSMEYTITVQEKEVTSSQSASGRRVSSGSSSSSKGSSKVKSTQNSDSDILDLQNQNGSLNLSGNGSSWFANNLTLFICGIAAAAGIAIIIFIAYKYGKKSSSKNEIPNQSDSGEETNEYKGNKQ